MADNCWCEFGQKICGCLACGWVPETTGNGNCLVGQEVLQGLVKQAGKLCLVVVVEVSDLLGLADVVCSTTLGLPFVAIQVTVRI